MIDIEWTLDNGNAYRASINIQPFDNGELRLDFDRTDGSEQFFTSNLTREAAEELTWALINAYDIDTQ